MIEQYLPVYIFIIRFIISIAYNGKLGECHKFDWGTSYGSCNRIRLHEYYIVESRCFLGSKDLINRIFQLWGATSNCKKAIKRSQAARLQGFSEWRQMVETQDETVLTRYKTIVELPFPELRSTLPNIYI